MASLIIAEDKLIEKDKFLRINPNITNEVLRAELENLVIEFDVEKQRIRNSFDKKIETLKDERRIEIKSMKNEFGEKREALFIKYGESRKKTKPAIKPNMEKREKSKKPLPKSK
jgi:DNA relaxase NicK